MSLDDLRDFERSEFTHDGKSRTVFRRGSGPAVIVIAEMPGITPKVLDFARKVVDLGCTAVLPHLFGDPGRDPNPKTQGTASTMKYMVSSLIPACVSKEFTIMATGRTSPVVDWLRALARAEHERCGGPGVGAVGMCFTGGYALAMATDDVILAPVLSQPSLPVGLTAKRRRNIDISPADLEVVKGRCARGLDVIGMRFKSDRNVPAERFEFLREQLGDAFIAVELEDVDANPDGFLPPHSVLTEHLIDEPGQATRAALDQVLDLFRTRLLVAG
ncbi:dienelactone hydrolase [Mycobacterium sp. CBMA293]|uniref:dienelactone hydrolase family protein n=1 Tax=unclassified Mycolicibacterium TaxID=2636767 RepID=UPI0012DE5103|nr:MULTISPECIES: dienelactone hydrolase family protein [unclassified Mycolicibacterium]MUL46718.1 dienelactone hydrolase [Mycolicibacterium sp. CBMA 360]MUL57498.1 dienelactone hydrolase [Mycolicibacterium sp. CBMA 335]MUL70538.1 dienelactone hydrolase [Mycolicibacterium sp. CBMA 311]MUL92586.1 dienelactone hydrolase [Mycolicibacterium sp. CBMA 230]MUM04962.1 dienelactone hydrolase [Mycolicibacterium sp. CBMA 213]